jgi:uncharacterized protein involved in exopolysaccharide biosynthesis
MLQTMHSQVPAQYPEEQAGFDPWHFVRILRKRWLYFAVPAVLIAAAGTAYVVMRPATYLSKGTVLIESQQIPVELVRPTVAGTTAARVQVIEQRLLTRDNLLAVASKFSAFSERRNWLGRSIKMSGTEILDKMRERTQIQPLEMNSRRPSQDNAIAFSLSFEHEIPEIAARVANELITLILAEDARNRSNRASETTQFLAREQKRLETVIGGIDAQIADFKRKNGEPVSSQSLSQISTLRAELEQKAALYAPSHPAMKPIQQQLAAVEKTLAQSAAVADVLDGFQRQKTAAQTNLDDVNQKLTVARRGEALERDQKAERLEVLEQPITPTEPVKGKRLKMLIGVLGAAGAIGFAGVFAAEMLDNSIRGSADLVKILDSRLIVSIPYISVRAELQRTRRVASLAAVILIAVIASGVVGVHYFWLPLDELWDKLLVRFAG